MERAPERGVKRAQPDTPAPFMELDQRRGRGLNTSRDVAGTAQTPASAERQGVEGTTEEMGAGARVHGERMPAGRGEASSVQS